MANIENFDPSKMGVDVFSYAHTIIIWVSVLLWAIIFVIAIYMLVRYFKYRIPVEIYEKRGNSLIMAGVKKARLKEKDGIREYELLDHIRGLFPRQQNFLKTFRIDKQEHIIPTRKGIAFKLLRDGDTFNPIGISNPNVKLEIIPYNQLWWLTTKIRQTNEKYDDRKWWEPYVLPLSIIAVAIICLLMIVLTLDKVNGIQQFCGAAEQSLSAKLAQTIK